MKKIFLLLGSLALLLSACQSTTEEVIESIELPEETELEIDFTLLEDIELTNGVKHSVPLSDILGGGPAKDGIPSIDEPQFVSVTQAAEFLNDSELGVMAAFDGVTRFYSYQILVWHEIVNDRIGGQAVLVTYCPLCGTGIVFNPEVSGEISEFGTSGKLWNSNLVMYDRLTESYWSQILGEAIVGELTGEVLELLPSQIITWETFKNQYPEGEVLSTDTGYSRDYTSTPYSGYEDSLSIFFPVDHTNDDFHPKAPSYGIEIDGIYKAYIQEHLEDGTFTDEVNGIELLGEFNNDTKNFTLYRQDTGEAVIPIYNFWFSWFAVHPETLVSPESI